MAVEPKRIPFDEFASHLQGIFDTLKREGRPLIVEREGELYRVEAEGPAPRRLKTREDVERARRALRASAGALRGVNREELLADIHAQREQDSSGRPAD